MWSEVWLSHQSSRPVEAAVDQQVGGKPGHPPCHQGQSLSGMGHLSRARAGETVRRLQGKRGQPAGEGERRGQSLRRRSVGEMAKPSEGLSRELYYRRPLAIM